MGHEKLDVYRFSIGYVAWIHEKAGSLTGVHRAARDQWLRASQSIPLNLAEGNGRTAATGRRRYFEIARGSVFERAAIQDVLVAGKALDERASSERKIDLDRMAAMLSRLGGRGYCIEKAPLIYGGWDVDTDSDRRHWSPGAKQELAGSRHRNRHRNRYRNRYRYRNRTATGFGQGKP